MRKAWSFVLCVCLIVLLAPANVLAGETVVCFRSTPGPLDNPMKGWYTWPTNTRYQPADLVLFTVNWSDLEPKEGVYRFAEWEKEAWSAPGVKGKHMVLRVRVDFPGQPSGLPKWLVAKGVKLTSYDGGLSPDYNNPVFVKAAEKLIAVMGARYDQDPRVACIQLGILGFWGEWHTWPHQELFATPATQRRIVDAYARAFHHKMIEGRTATGFMAKPEWLGYHDDYFPYDTDDGDGLFVPLMRSAGRGDCWKRVMIGGEMAPGKDVAIFGKDFKMSMSRIESGHFTFLGSGAACIKDQSPEFRCNSQAMVRRMGYEYRLIRLRHPSTVRRGGDLRIALEGVNQGVAPFYYPWPIEIALIDSSGKIAQITYSQADIRTWLPGSFGISQSLRVSVKPGIYRIGIGIVDPMTKKPSIRFANDLLYKNGWTYLSHVTVR